MNQHGSRHIIKRQVFELRGLRQEDAQQVQQQVARLAQDHIVPLLDAHLSALSPNGSVLRLEKLELNLGTIPFDEWESELLRLLDLKLTNELARLAPLPEQRTASQPGSQNAPQAARPSPPTYREVLHYFVGTGSLPWWADPAARGSAGADRTSAEPVAESMEYLLKQEPVSLSSDLQRWVAQESYLLRLIRHVPDEMLFRLAALRIQLQPTALSGVAPGFFRWLPRIAALAGQPLYRVREQAHLKLLQIAFSASAPVRDAGIFWEEWLLQVAVALRVKYKPMLQELSGAVGGGHSGFTAVLRRLSSGKTNTKPRPSVPDQVLRDLEETLLPVALGQWPAWRDTLRRWRSNTVPATALEQLFKALEQALPPDAARPGSPLEPEQLENASARALVLWKTLLKKWTAAIIRRLGDNGLPRSLRTALEAAKKRLQASGFRPSELPALLAHIARVEAEAARATEAVEPADLEFSEAGELFVENAGLVILWPFLTQFFEGLHLLENGRFTDDAAAHRAARLLQYLADGQTEAPEYLMALNKLLCGLPWDVVLDAGPALSEAEMEECEALLQAVVVNAPVLGNMQPDGLRGSFLLRKGVLRPVAGAWELRVEKATHDVVLERFPWSWSVVKLPWLEGVLLVEW